MPPATIREGGRWPGRGTKARELRVTLDNGHDPAAEKKAREAEEARRTSRVSAVVDDWLEVHKRDMKPRSTAKWTRHLRVHWKPLHKLMLGAVTRQDIAAQMRTMARDSGPVAADRARGALSAMFAWGRGGAVRGEPGNRHNKATEEKSRERVLDDGELAAVWKAASDDDSAGSSDC